MKPMTSIAGCGAAAKQYPSIQWKFARGIPRGMLRAGSGEADALPRHKNTLTRSRHWLCEKQCPCLWVPS